MFNPLKGLSDLRGLQQQAQKMQEILSKEEVSVEKDGVKVVVSGNQEVKEVAIDGQTEERVARAINEAIQKTQRIAATKLFEMSQQ